MKKIFILCLLCVFLCCACKHDRGIILFNSQPINETNVLNDSKVFTRDQRVYYLFLAPKKMDNEYIRIQISKMTDKAPWGGHEVCRTKDYRLMKDERYYHKDYFVFHEKGRYLMQVFSSDDYVRPLSIGDFYVK